MIIGLIGILITGLAIILSPVAYMARKDYDVRLIYILAIIVVGFCYAFDGKTMVEYFYYLRNSVANLPW